MHHRLVTIESFEFVGAFSMRIKFSDQKIQEVDFLPILHGEIYGPLRSEVLFQQVRIDPETKTLIWTNGADFDPALLYDWDNVKDELCSRAKQWDVAP